MYFGSAGSSYCAGFSLVEEAGASVVRVLRLLIMAASLVHRLWARGPQQLQPSGLVFAASGVQGAWASAVRLIGPVCSRWACGIFPDGI